VLIALQLQRQALVRPLQVLRKAPRQAIGNLLPVDVYAIAPDMRDGAAVAIGIDALIAN